MLGCLAVLRFVLRLTLRLVLRTVAGAHFLQKEKLEKLNLTLGVSALISPPIRGRRFPELAERFHLKVTVYQNMVQIIWMAVVGTLSFVICLSSADIKPTGQRGRIDTPRGVLDVTQPPYNADPTGTKDSSDILQRAIHDGFVTQKAVFSPLGRYLVSKPIEVRRS